MSGDQKHSREAVRMDNELDLVVFEDDDGNELTMEVLDYLF